MNYKKLKILSILFLLEIPLLIISPSNRPKSSFSIQSKDTTDQKNIINVPYNKMNVIGRILNVETSCFPYYIATIVIEKIIKKETISFTKLNDTIKVLPYYLKDKSGSLIHDEKYIRLVQLRKSPIESKILAEIYFQGSEYGKQWFLLDVKKINN